jgi:hypothetical protein
MGYGPFVGQTTGWMDEWMNQSIKKFELYQGADGPTQAEINRYPQKEPYGYSFPCQQNDESEKQEDCHLLRSAEHRMDTPNRLCDADCSRGSRRHCRCLLRHSSLLVIATSCCKQPQKHYKLSHRQPSGWPWLLKFTYFKSNHYSVKTAG